jgi:ABC-2 type transport system permease protein
VGRIFAIFQYTVLQNVRDVGNSIGQMVVFPIVLIIILGLAMSPMFQPESIGATRVGYFNEDQGPMGSLVDDFMARPEVNELLDIRVVDSLTAGQELLRTGEISALIHVESDYSQQAMGGEKAEIQVIGHPGRQLGVTMVETVLESFVCGGNAIQAMLAMGAGQPQYAPALGSIQEHPISAQGLMPNAMGYYAVTMLVMIIMYGSLYSTYTIKRSYLAAIGRRIKASPIRSFEQYFGLIMANIVTVYIQALVIIAFTHFAFKVSWGDNLPLVLLIVFIMVVLSTGLGTMAVMVAKEESRASSFLNVIVVAFTFISGGYFKVSLSGVLAHLQYLSPNYLAQTALFNTIYHGSNRQTMLMLAGMLAIIAVTFAISMLAERRVVQ